MTILQSRVSTHDEEFRLNRAAYEALIAELHEKRRSASVGGSASARERHLARDKMLPRDRVEALLDPGSPFLELAQLAGEGRYEGVPPGASLITGIGLVSGRPCMVIANDATVKGGTYFGLTCKKHVRAQQIAQAHRLPCITLVDSGGAFLPDMANIFPDVGQFGSIFNNQVRMSAEGIPQIAVVMGPCTAGGAYIPALCDQVGDRPRAGDDLPGRSRADVCRDQRGGRRREPRRGADAFEHQRRHRPDRRGRPPRARDHARARPRPRRTPCAALAARGAAAAAPGSARDPRSRQPRPEAADRHPRGARALRRRQPLPGVQAALRRHAADRVRPAPRPCRSASSPTRASSSPRAR